MTTTRLDAATERRVSPTQLHRVWQVVRLLFVNPRTLISTPWMVLAIIFLANLAIWGIIAVSTGERAVSGTQFSGGIFYLFVYMTVAGVLSITASFPFALGFSVTRRDYYLGTVASFLLVSAADSILIVALSVIEKATGGWGLGGHFFTVVYLGENVGERLFVYFVGLLFFFFVGASVAGIYMRWRISGMLTLVVIVLIIGLGLIALAAFTGSWGAVGAWFLSAGPVGVATVLLIPTVLAAVTGYFVLRGATPKS